METREVLGSILDLGLRDVTPNRAVTRQKHRRGFRVGNCQAQQNLTSAAVGFSGLQEFGDNGSLRILPGGSKLTSSEVDRQCVWLGLLENLIEWGNLCKFLPGDCKTGQVGLIQLWRTEDPMTEYSPSFCCDLTLQCTSSSPRFSLRRISGF